MSRAAVLVLVLLLAPAASAAPVNYGGFAGTTVDFLDVTEDAGPDVVLFGAPIVSGNSLDFNPLAFSASANGGGSDEATSALSFAVAAKAGSAIHTIALGEAGNATLVGAGSDSTSGTVVATGTLRIQQVDFVGIPEVTAPIALAFAPSGGSYFLGTDGGGLPLFETQWSGSQTFDLDAILSANTVAFVHGATRITIELTNALSATSESETFATINKSDVSVLVATVPGADGAVPEPGTMTLIGAGLAGLAIWRRRRRP